MNKQKHRLVMAGVVAALLLLLPAAAQADPIILTLDMQQSLTQGERQPSTGRSRTPGRFINGVSLTLDGSPAGFTFDDSPFFSTVPAFLAPGALAGPGPFFNVMVAIAVAPGSYTGSFSVLGGADDAAQDILATQEFVINVLPAGGVPIPEPATCLLMVAGLAGIVACRRSRRG